MSKRKWHKSSVTIRDLNCLMDSCKEYKGVWCVPMNKFCNEAWVRSQQLRVLERYLAKGCFMYPEMEGDK